MPITWIIMSWLSTYFVYIGPPIGLLLLWLLLRPIYRGLWVPKAVRRAGRTCGQCGHGCPEQLPERCSECGSFYSAVGIQTPGLVAKTREGLFGMLVSWASFCGLLAVVTFALIIAYYPFAQSTATHWKGSVEFAGEREHIWDREANAGDQMYDAMIQGDVVAVQGEPATEASYTMTLMPGVGPTVLVEWGHPSDDWIATGAGEPITGTGFDSGALIQIFELANLDPLDERIIKEIGQIEEIMTEIKDDPSNALMNNGLWSIINGIQMGMNPGMPEVQEDPIMDESFPWVNNSGMSWGGNEREFGLGYQEENQTPPAAPSPLNPFPMYQQIEPDVWADFTITGSERAWDSEHGFENTQDQQLAKSFRVSLTDRSGWPVVVSVDLEEGSWTLDSDPELDTRKGDSITRELWELAWEEVGRDPENENDTEAIDALLNMALAAADNRDKALLNQNNQMQVDMPVEEVTPGGLTHSYNLGGGGSSFGPAGMGSGYIPPEFKAAIIIGAAALLLWIVGTVLMIRRRRKLFTANSPAVAA